MVFSSYLFLFAFLPVALGLYFGAPRRARNLVLTLVSYFFYGWTNPAFCVLLLLSTVIDWICGLVQSGATPWGPDPEPLAPGGPRSRRQRVALVASIVSNLSLLGFFKYFDFAVGSWNGLANALGLPEAAVAATLEVTLPLGISFYTFQSMSYSIDVWRGRAAAMRSFVDFACFVSMFPQLVAGPIVRFSEIADQLRVREVSLARAARGLAFLSVGLAKKVLLANPCGKIADTVFDAASSSALDAWYGLVAYSFQIYYDFSGYSDMAIGLGLFFGFVFPKNFDSPYRSRSVTEFWRRWHLSLSTWLRDYLYIPLGGNQRGPRRTYVNLAATMLLGGLWHGASWNFVAWGALHGAALTLERAVTPERLYGRLPGSLRTAIVFGFVTLAWIPFRAKDFPSALDFLARLFGIQAATPAASLLPGLLHSPYLVLSFLAAAAVVWGGQQTWTWTRELTPARAAASVALLALAVAALATQRFNPFIYFIF